MDIESVFSYCQSIKGSEVSTPFDDVTVVFKVCGKMFALIPTDAERHSINLKCDAKRAIELRENYSWIEPGYHMSKIYWNTVYIDDATSDDLLKELIHHSVDEVIKKLPKKTQKEYYDKLG